MIEAKALMDAIKAMTDAQIDMKRISQENIELLKETFELASRNEKLKYQNGELLALLKDCINGVNCQPGYIRSQTIIRIQQAIREAE